MSKRKGEAAGRGPSQLQNVWFPDTLSWLCNRGTRETVESIAIAIILALLFRTFEAEAFVIPTGSMAPALQGQHKDVQCPRCEYWYQVGASERHPAVFAGTCPMCRFTQEFDRANCDHQSYAGDRILVNKFIYEFFEPQRWDVIVFKYPIDAKQNYIKRLVGLPGETVVIRHGDVYAGRGDEAPAIVRKPAHKLAAMLQPVHDTRYIPQALADAGWPSRWQPADGAQGGFATADGGRTFTLGANPGENWLRYRHIVPGQADWLDIMAGRPLPPRKHHRGQLITDLYAYNTYQDYNSRDSISEIDKKNLGTHWVGDLAVECEVEVLAPGGQLKLDLVEGGRHYQCRIDLASGVAELSIDGGKVPFTDASGQPAEANPKAPTAVVGPGRYTLRLANVDDEMTLWVNGWAVTFDRPATYQSPRDMRAVWSVQDPGDLAPAGLGASGVSLRVNRLAVYRDIYYIAVDGQGANLSDYDAYEDREGRQWFIGHEMLAELFTDPQLWDESPVWDARRTVAFTLDEGQFMPLGDNSPQSADARSWGREHYVEGHLLTGKAFCVFWPHMWCRPINVFGYPLTPNFGGMKRIK